MLNEWSKFYVNRRNTRTEEHGDAIKEMGYKSSYYWGAP